MTNPACMMTAYAELDRRSIAGHPLTGYARTKFLNDAREGKLVLEVPEATRRYFGTSTRRHGQGWSAAQAAVMTDQVRRQRGE